MDGRADGLVLGATVGIEVGGREWEGPMVGSIVGGTHHSPQAASQFSCTEQNSLPAKLVASSHQVSM